jgi:hypothetical protein
VSARTSWIDRLANVAPALFGVPVVLGLLVSITGLLGTHSPDLGWAVTVNSDAEALYLGHTLYQDPAAGYTGQLYTPLFPALVSVLHHIHLWAGWAPLVTLFASGGLLALAAWLAYAPAGAGRLTRLTTLVGAIGMGGLAYWAVGGMYLPLLFEGRVDQAAWLLALSGLVATARITPGAPLGRTGLAVTLLTLALWAKQNTISASVVAGLWILAGGAIGWLSLREVARFVAGLAAANVVVLGLLNLVTGGWEFRLSFIWPTRHSTSELIKPWIAELVRGDALGVAIVAAMFFALLVAWLYAGRPTLLQAGSSLRARLAATLDVLPVRGSAAILLLAFGIIGGLFGIYFRRKQGGADNQFLGVVWATGLLAAALWGLARRWRPAAWTAAVMVVVGFALVSPMRSALEGRRIIVPPLKNDVETWPQVAPDLLAYARTHTIYTEGRADLNVASHREVSPNLYNFVDLLAAGEQPKALVNRFLDRHFDAVSLFAPGTDTYASAYGKWEENYLWKLNQVIAARYEARPGTPAGLLVRKRGPEADPWMRTCFGPFEAGGVPWRIGLGGGFWCQAEAGGPLQMRGTPSSATQVRTQAPLRRASGQAVLTVPAPGFAVLKLAKITQEQPAPAAKWTVALAHPKKGSRLVEATVNGGAPLRLRPGVEGRVTVRLVDGAPASGRVVGDDTIEVPIPPADDDAQLALEANQGTNLSADLSGLRLELTGKGV